ncbi:MAG: DUF1905 domain-containing protein, partial [Pseudomonadota bacterium]
MTDGLFFDREFEAVIEHHDVGSARYLYTVVFVPADEIATLPLGQYPRLRINAEISDYPIDASLTPVKGRWYVLLSKKVLGAIGAGVGDRVSVRYRIADQDEVDVPPALAEALKHD